MTLVLALRYHEGVVIASDGQATTDASGQPTRQAVRKLFATGRSIAWGAAGSVGLRQQLAEALAAQVEELDETADPRGLLVATVSAVQRAALADFVPLPGRRPPELCALFCWWPRGDGPLRQPGGPVILTVPATGAGHQLHARWAAIGSGDVFAGYAMRAAGALGAESLPAAAARVLAYGVVADAVATAAALLGPPIQLAEVTRARGARVLDDAVSGRLAGELAGWRARQRAALLDAA
jgi:ATP-dependent protease HslVU (ClpYQ) peptidase subunit